MQTNQQSEPQSQLCSHSSPISGDAGHTCISAWTARSCSSGTTSVHGTQLRHHLPLGSRAERCSPRSLGVLQSLAHNLRASTGGDSRTTTMHHVQVHHGHPCHASDGATAVPSRSSDQNIVSGGERVLRIAMGSNGRGAYHTARRPTHEDRGGCEELGGGQYLVQRRRNRTRQSTEATSKAEFGEHAASLDDLNPMTRPGMRLYELLHHLMDMSVWRLIDSTMRGERGRPTPLAESVRTLVYPRST